MNAPSHPDDAPSVRATPTRGQGLPAWLGLCFFLAIAGFFLWEEHQAHLLGAIPYVLLLLCPAVHLLMHRGHGDHGGSRTPAEHKGRRGRGTS